MTGRSYLVSEVMAFFKLDVGPVMNECNGLGSWRTSEVTMDAVVKAQMTKPIFLSTSFPY